MNSCPSSGGDCCNSGSELEIPFPITNDDGHYGRTDALSYDASAVRVGVSGKFKIRVEED